MTLKPNLPPIKSDQIIYKPIDQIKPDPNQQRTTFNENDVQDMANSIKTVGIINAIEIDEDNIIVTGECRWRAAKLLGLKEIPCTLTNITGRNRLRRQLIENFQKQKLKPWDTANALKKLLELHLSKLPGELKRDAKHKSEYFQKGIADLAKEIGKNEDYIREHFDMLKLMGPILKKVKSGELPRTITRALNIVPEQHRKKLEKKLINKELDRDTANYLARATQREPEAAEKLLEQDYSNQTKSQVKEMINNIVSEVVIDEYTTIVNKCVQLLTELDNWLNDHSLEEVPNIMKPWLMQNLAITDNNINRWLTNEEELIKKLKQLTAEDNSVEIIPN